MGATYDLITDCIIDGKLLKNCRFTVVSDKHCIYSAILGMDMLSLLDFQLLVNGEKYGNLDTEQFNSNFRNKNTESRNIFFSPKICHVYATKKFRIRARTMSLIEGIVGHDFKQGVTGIVEHQLNSIQVCLKRKA